MSQSKPKEIKFALELDGNYGKNSDSQMTKYEGLRKEYFGEKEENRSEVIKQFREKLEKEEPLLLKSLPGPVADDFLIKVLRAGTASGKLYVGFLEVKFGDNNFIKNILTAADLQSLHVLIYKTIVLHQF